MELKQKKLICRKKVLFYYECLRDGRRFFFKQGNMTSKGIAKQMCIDHIISFRKIDNMELRIRIIIDYD